MLTKRGALLLVLAALTFALADLLALRVLYMLSLALLLLFPMSLLQVRRSSRLFTGRREVVPNPCPEGSVVEIELLVSTHGRVSGFLTRADDMVPSPLSRESISYGSDSMQALLNQKYRVRATRRGFYEIGPVSATVTDAFGIVQRSLRLAETSRLVVYPRHSPVEIFGGKESSEMLGLRTTGKKGASPDFLKVREYQPGDEVKTIHWRSSAKRGRLMVRELDKEETPSTLVVLNCERNANRGQGSIFELGVRVAASVCVSALREDIEVKLVLQGEEVDIVERSRGPVQYHRVLSALAGVEAGGNIPLNMILERLSREELGRGALHVVSTSLEDRDVDSIAHMMRRGFAPTVILTRTLEDVGDHTLRRLRGLGARVGLAADRQNGTVISWMN